jgi:hypothetical protein
MWKTWDHAFINKFCELLCNYLSRYPSFHQGSAANDLCTECMWGIWDEIMLFLIDFVNHCAIISLTILLFIKVRRHMTYDEILIVTASNILPACTAAGMQLDRCHTWSSECTCRWEGLCIDPVASAVHRARCNSVRAAVSEVKVRPSWKNFSVFSLSIHGLVLKGGSRTAGSQGVLACFTTWAWFERSGARGF